MERYAQIPAFYGDDQTGMPLRVGMAHILNEVILLTSSKGQIGLED